MARAGRRARQRARRRTAARARQGLRRPDDEQSEASEWSEIDESEEIDSLHDFFGDSDDEDSRDGSSLGPLDDELKIIRDYMRDDRYRDAVELLATHPNGLGLLEAKLSRFMVGFALITRRDGSYRTLLHHSAAFESEPRVTGVLLRHGANVNVHMDNSLTPLHLAAKRANNARTIACLLEHGATVDARDDMDRTPLMVAARFDRQANCEALLAAGADVEACDNVTSWTALHYAARQLGGRCVGPLIDAGAGMNSEIFDYAMVLGSTRTLYRMLPRPEVTELLKPRFGAFGTTYRGCGKRENLAYLRRVGVAGSIALYQRDQRRKLVSLLRRHVAPRAPDDVLHVIVSFWGHAGSY